MSNIQSDSKVVKFQNKEFTAYWTGRAIDPGVIAAMVKGDYIEYYSQVNGHPERFQRSKTVDWIDKNQHTGKETPHKAFDRLSFSPITVPNIPLYVSPSFNYTAFSNTCVVEGLPDAYSILTAGLPAIALKSKGALRHAKKALQEFLSKFPNITKLSVIPDPDGWQDWTQYSVWWDFSVKVTFVNIEVALAHAGVTGKDVNDLWKALQDTDQFVRALQSAIITVEPPVQELPPVPSPKPKSTSYGDLQRILDDLQEWYTGERMAEYAMAHAPNVSPGLQETGDEIEIRSNDGFYVKPKTRGWRIYGKHAGGIGIVTLATYLLYGVNCVKGGDFSKMLNSIADFAGYVLPELKRSKVTPHSDDADVPPLTFWYIDKKGVLKLDRRCFCQWLASQGFGVMRYDNRLVFVRIKGNVVSECLTEHGQVIDAKIAALTFVQTHHFDDVENMLLTGHIGYFGLSALNILPRVELPFCRDTKQSAFLFFQNCFVEVRKDRIITRPYTELQGYIWENQVLPYEYHGKYAENSVEIQQPDGEFFDFMVCVTSQNISEDRSEYEMNCRKIEAFFSAYGYLLHGWKDKTESRAVICVDGTLGRIDDDGRTGKSLFLESLKHLKNVGTENGKTWKPDDRFAYQNVSLDTQIFFVDDLSKTFKIEFVYPAVTGDLTVEEKNKQKMTIPFALSPKFAFTSNSPLRGEGDSDKARRCVLPFSRFFSLTYRPKDHFGHTFFDEWSSDEWQNFFDFAIFAINFYMQKGLLDYDDPEHQHARLTMQIPETVFDLFIGLSRDVEHDKDAVAKSLQNDVTGMSKHLFTKWLKIFCEYWRGTEEEPERLEFSERRTFKHGERVHLFQLKKVG